MSTLNTFDSITCE